MESIVNVRKQSKRLIIVMFIIMLFAGIGSLFFGRYSISLKELNAFLAWPVTQTLQEVSEQTLRVIWRIRIPRVIAGVLVGAALAVSGGTFQALFKNPMASSNVLGVNQGAAFGAALAILYFLPNQAVIIVGFITGLIAVGLTYVMSSRFKMERMVGLILSGMVVGAIFQAGISFIKLIADPENVLPTITYWLLGSLSGISWKHLQTSIIPMLIGFILIFINRKQLNLLTLGDEKAQTLGVNLKRTRIQVIIGATLLTASSVAISGMIGWISLVIPHMCRFIVGSDYRYLIPCSAFMGGAFLVIIDTLARSLTQIEIPIGILTALLGAPLFVFLIIKGGRLTYANR